ncbi:putative C2 domain, phosphoribosyltransferase, C2 domain superfamily [Helianthus annuus]|uniref:C2 domain, phosphoribosyltransferase, C2 domain superfamily n=2 Tax=Helianthus annuus TaxID=4232 RepID=A0A251UKH8_HELAN|nr:putative C2 domain, phosphoribosyltransferase, C2 domain superfamily [Helianthus annuus]KAJ0573380.1 putative C2 domain, phosphoribosyltransferase, C2 domain superfamily [Helianthus annuus]KAJ0911684.1 putative C2 domain, phosphoribosyltransferase, C2 domain superfamily [Helianthus annuus]
MKIKDGRATTYAYCVAKYGTKWFRTRTITESLTPKWNVQHSWEVYDPCTILNIGVFDDFPLPGLDTQIGKVRIRVSTLETDRVYIHSYPLLVLRPSGVKNMGEINLAVRFTCSSLVNMMQMYSQPLLPEMHYICPLNVRQLDSLRHHAIQIVSMRFSQAEPPLSKEVVEYVLDVGSDMWSWRRIKANYFRIMEVFHGLNVVGIWFVKNPINIVVIHIIFFILAMYPDLIVSSIFLTLFVIGIWNYRRRPMYPPPMDACLLCTDNADPDEEFDTFPTSDLPDMTSMRYDGLRGLSGRIQVLVGDLATLGERVESLLSWRDPIATFLFVMFCLIAAMVLYATPFYVVVIQSFIYVLYHQKILPSVLINFFRRLPTRTDSML